MCRVLFAFALLIAAASAFVTPANQAALSSPAFVARDAPKMNMIENVDFSAINEVVASSNMIASSVNDFGGYLFPVFGVAALAAIILYLSPPLVDE